MSEAGEGENLPATPGTNPDPVVVGERQGMFGVSDGGDTSGYGGLVAPVLFPAAAVLLAPVERATLSDLVSLGFGLALEPASAMGAFHPGVSVRPIAGPIAPIAFHAVWRGSNRNPELERFLADARAHAEAWRG